ncbi:MAG: hypothetical protein MUF15_24655 [Acidobacteria bacterium]|jgi:hypothetical protein|nr:hypothetical protein [Acidobacteriota bacterium]
MKNKNDENNILLTNIREGYNLPAVYFQVKVEKALVKKDIKTVLNLNQLTGSRFDNFYTDTEKVRDGNTVSSLKELLSDPLNPYVKRLFTGFVGSGKTTELIKLCFHLEMELNVIIFSVWNRLKINELTIESLLFEIMEDLLQYLHIAGLLPENEPDRELREIIDKIEAWCSEVEIIKEKSKDQSWSLAAGVDLLKVAFFNAKTESRSSRSDKTVSTRIEERKINDLIFECNKIFDYLKDKTGKDTVLIIDDIEKMAFLKAREFYIQNASFIRDFHCKMVLTIPVELIYHSDFSIIQNVFGDAEVLPMIKIKDMNGNEFQQGIECLTDILNRRMDLSLFENRCYKKAIRYSGGLIRELFNIIQRAALIEEADKISEVSMNKSIDYHKDTFASRIQERRDEITIKFEEYLEILFDISDGNKTGPKRNLALLDLLRTRAVMKYNGQGFYDTHPLLDTFIKTYKEKKIKKSNEK